MSHATSPPSIRIYDSGPAPHNRYAISRRSSAAATSSSSSSSTIPMAIPNARGASPPPPLPPPRFINELSDAPDPNWWTNGHTNGSYGRQYSISGKPEPGLFGSSKTSPLQRSHTDSLDERPDYPTSRRESTYSPPRHPSSDLNSEPSDTDRASMKKLSLIDHRLQSEKQLGQKSLENSSQAYDKQLLSKIGGPNTPTRTQAPGFLSTSAQDAPSAPSATFGNPKGQLKPMPERLYTSLDSPATRWAPSGTISPGQSGFRSPIFDSASSDSMSSRLHGNTSAIEESASASRSHRGSYDHGIFMDNDFAMDENGIRDLNINDRSPGIEEYQLKGGLKRRASSPPSEAAREDRPTGSGTNDLYHRRSQQMLVNRSSPVSRFHANPGSLSSTSSFGQRGAGSYGSSFGLSIASSATSYSERLSPSALSPSTETELGPLSPFLAANRSGQHNSPRGSLSRPSHQRGPAETEPPHNRKLSSDSLIHSRHNSVSKMSGLYICECCPKKPKKFESEDELRNHELEKQYTCAFCPNRFKNKNEAERHQNSLHLRRHSWSCAALEGPHAAFHQSTAHPGAADMCGYCGKEFANPPNWDERNDHLNHVHKFGECNQAKKFFRADHFRQHLKHSHAGSSGRWTNMLENACMKDEPPPSTTRLPRNPLTNAFDGTTNSNSAGIGTNHNPSVINEVHDES